MSRKPLSIALEEIEAGKIIKADLVEEVPEADVVVDVDAAEPAGDAG